VTAELRTAVGTALLGRALDARGRALDGGAAPGGLPRPLIASRPALRERAPVEQPLWTGVRVVDGLLTLGRGARAGIFGAPGAGKSTLLETIVAGARADACVVALIGERGREAERWLRAVGPRTTLVCATADEPAAERRRAAYVAFAQAEHLRIRGLHVLLVVDSLARFVAALRELAAARGELPGRGGYPPSAFAELAALVERAGAFAQGSITLLATVLSDGPDPREPLSDAAKSVLDGHLLLSEELAQAGHFPAVAVTLSASRTMDGVVAAGHAASARRVRGALSLLEQTREARMLGVSAAAPGSPLAAAVAAEPALTGFLRQDAAPARPGETLQALARLADTL
jgi:type III secretion protein N (ATPase)